jgi:hypothetical protein
MLHPPRRPGALPALACALALATSARAGAAGDPWAPLDLPSPLSALLSTGHWDGTPPGFRIVALSFLADGCAAQAAREPALREAALACVDRALALAETTARPRRAQAGDPAEDGLWLSHLALILGARDRLGPCADPDRHRRAAEALAARALREPTLHVPSFPGVERRWPADQSATLAALARHDRAHGTHLADEPARRWRAWVLAHAMDRRLELPWSEATGRAPGARTPRGCALSWQTRYLHEFDPELASRWWATYREKFLVDRVALVGFREWPAGRERAADADSGPIVHGVGAAATALGISAARSMGDDLLAARLEATATAVSGLAALSPTLRRHAHTALAEAIRYLGAQPPP